MIVRITYVDEDYGEKLEDDEFIFGIKDNLFEKFVEDFYNYSFYYTHGYDISEILDNDNSEEILLKEYPGLSKTEAQYFARIRECGLSACSVMVRFLERYPFYNMGNSNPQIIDIKFNEYYFKVNGLNCCPEFGYYQ